MKINVLSVFLTILIWGLCISAAVSIYALQWVHGERTISWESGIYIIKPGASLHSVAEDLSNKGIIHWPKVWVMYAQIADLNKIKAGEHQLDTLESPASLLEKFNSNNVVQYAVTFVEGRGFSDVMIALRAKENIKKTLVADRVLEQINKADIHIAYVEGWFFPDTYHYMAGDTDISILQRAYKKMVAVLSEEWISRAENLPYDSAYDALIMASIVEKETGAAYERSEIAGVFVRRLERGMRLQTDPTVIYGMGEGYTGNITRKDLKTPTPYNTYTNSGLPPTPIAMPGREAIHAAMHPAQGLSLYFVAKGDGTHYFSATIEEHNEAVQKFQKKRVSDYRSSPEPLELKTHKNEDVEEVSVDD
ncbi:MAG: UPF0755 protein [Lentisphaeria bacterium]|jgi:UPF0755 protein